MLRLCNTKHRKLCFPLLMCLLLPSFPPPPSLPPFLSSCTQPLPSPQWVSGFSSTKLGRGLWGGRHYTVLGITDYWGNGLGSFSGGGGRGQLWKSRTTNWGSVCSSPSLFHLPSQDLVVSTLLLRLLAMGQTPKQTVEEMASSLTFPLVHHTRGRRGGSERKGRANTSPAHSERRSIMFSLWRGKERASHSLSLWFNQSVSNRGPSLT